MVYVLIWAHCFADFFMQTDQQAKNKSSSNYWLANHIICYMWWMWLALRFSQIFVGSYSNGATCAYVLLNGLAHFCTDYITSRITKRLWEKKDVHNFFAVIGVDQALHLTVLVATMPLLNYRS